MKFNLKIFRVWLLFSNLQQWKERGPHFLVHPVVSD